eukprot:GSChrysophyteH1.ASY1.ANO1.2392.1 assembled CDS
MNTDISDAAQAVAITCTMCQTDFPSKRKLFRHLETVHDLVSDRAQPCKVACLVGWLSHEGSDIESYLKDSRLVSNDGPRLLVDENGNALTEDERHGNGTTKARVETALFQAIHKACDAGLPLGAEARMKKEARSDGASSDTANDASQQKRRGLSKGHTRGSQTSESTLALGLERTCHASADTFMMTLQRPPGNEQSWLDKVNKCLPDDIRVLTCRILPGKGSDLNAYTHCSQRRFEYMMPLDLLLPQSEQEFAACANLLVDERSIKPRHKRSWNQDGPKSALDEEFPENTPEGERRVRFFRILKLLMKNFGGRYQMFYNYASGGACPEDPYSQRTVDRMYHKSMRKSDDGVTWVIFSISGDNFLRGQIRRMFGTAIAVARGWLPEQFVDFSLRSSTCEPLCIAPSVPAPGLYLAECKYGNYEAKYEAKGGFVLDPRRSREENLDEVDRLCIGSINDWEDRVQQHIMNSPQMKAACKNWSAETKLFCEKLWKRVEHDMSLLSRSEVMLQQRARQLYPAGGPTSIDTAPEVYRKVLKLLQEVDHSGAWPRSSFARQALLGDSVAHSAPSAGGTFTLGAFPSDQQQPKGNILFPELLRAVFELERLILPNRTPSTTIAINKHAQFKIHRDSGAGSGQSTSAIVALGNFVGGELGLDWQGIGEAKSIQDIRYSPAEFCGWTSRHFTLPFAGERYSLVWFTPLGCGRNDQFWWDDIHDQEVSEAKRARV